MPATVSDAIVGGATVSDAFHIYVLPSTITGLDLWLVADDLTGADGSAIASWLSKEGNTYNFVQATGTKQPLLKKGTNGINGHNIVRFDGTNDILVGPNFSTATQGTVFIVVRLDSTLPDFQTALCTSDQVTSDYFWMARAYHNYAVFTVNQYNGGPPEDKIVGSTLVGLANKTYLQMVKSNGTVASMRVNGNEETVSVITGVNNGNWFGDIPNRDNFTIGGFKCATEQQFLKGDIAEILVYDTALAADNISLIEDYLFTQYAITDALDLPRVERCQDYVDQQLGTLICWNMPSFTDQEYSDPDIDPDTFAPTDLDINQWMDACVSAGMKYAQLTTKHSDGFALWPTLYAAPAHSPYGITATTWWANNGHPDVVDLFVDSCRAHNISPCLYFSLSDYTYEARTGTTVHTDPAGYLAMIEMQLSELLTNYGAIAAIFLDHWGADGFHEHIPYPTIYEYVKSLQPNTILITSEIPPLDIVITETPVTPGNTILSEEVKKIYISGHWFWTHDGVLKDAATINAEIQNAITNNATFSLGITPDQTGHLPADQVALLATIHI